MRCARSFLILGLLGCLVGCGSSGDGDSGACQPGCAAGFACVNAVCVAANSCDPACVAGFVCEAGQCVADPSQCVPACGAGFECSGGTCAELPCVPDCGQGLTCVQGECVLNSTLCDPPCQAGETCQAGQCNGTTPECNPPCANGSECQNGQCVSLVVDCDPACGDGFICQDGQCTAVATGSLVINEFLVTPTDQESVELYNGSDAPVPLNGWVLHVQTGQESTWSLPAQELPVGQFLLLTIDNLTPLEAGDSILPNAGATLWLTDASGAIADSVSYGTDGSAPTPIYATSTARVGQGTDTDMDGNDFNWDPTPTLGSANDVPGVSLGNSPIALSELFWLSGDDVADFIELDVLSDSTVDVSGWVLVFSGSGTGDDMDFSAGTNLQPGYWVLEETDFPEYAKLKESGVLYLFDSTGVRVYQMGWTGLTNDGSASLGYLPGQMGAPDCFDSATCGLQSLTPSKGTANQL